MVVVVVFVGLCVPKLGTQHVLHSTCLVLQSRKFVSARPCISVPCGSLSAQSGSGGRGFKLSSGSLDSQSHCVMHSPHCPALPAPAGQVRGATELRNEASGEKM